MTGLVLILVGVAMAAFDKRLQRELRDHTGVVLLWEFGAFMLVLNGLMIAAGEWK